MQKNGLFKQGVTHQGKTRGMRPLIPTSFTHDPAGRNRMTLLLKKEKKSCTLLAFV